MDTVGIGIVGAGFLAETRARCYGQDARARLVAVTSATPERAESYAARNGVLAVCPTFVDLLRREDVDVVDLCVPNLLHRPMAVSAAAAGKHVVCTKPLAAYVGQDLSADAPDAVIGARSRDVMMQVAVADAQAMVEAARAGGVQLMYGENWVYAPPIVRAAGLLATSRGVVLEMHGFEAHSGSHAPYAKTWRHAGGGALLRLASHPIGAMLHLKALEGEARRGQAIRAVSVTADVGDLSQVAVAAGAPSHLATGWADVETFGVVVITFDDGSRGVAHGSDNLLGGMQSKLRIRASDCTLECNLSPHDLVRAYAPGDDVFGSAYIMEKLSGTGGWSTPLPDEDWSSGHLAMCRDFVGAVLEGRPARATGDLGLEVTRVVYGAYRAAAEGCRIAL
jgi:predicted dehydrogenase